MARTPPLLVAIAGCLIALAIAGCGGGAHSTIASIGPTKPATVEVGSNVVRIPGTSPGDVAASAVLTQYGAGGESPPAGGWILVREDAWHEAMVAAQFAAKPVSAALVPIKADWIPPGPADVLRRVRVAGFPRAQGLQALVLGSAGSDVFLELEHDLGLKMTQLRAGSPEALAGAVVPFRGGWARSYSSNVVVVSSQQVDYALPGAAWSAFSGDSLAFVSRKGVPRTTVALLKQREKLRLEKPTIYIIGPRSIIPDSVVAQLAPYGTVKRIAGRSSIETAIALARYHDKATGFGWGITHGPASVSLVDERDWANAFAAFTYAANGPEAPLLLTNRPDRLPPEVVKYVRSLQGPQANQGYVFGSPKSVSSTVVGELDRYLAPAK